MIGALVLVLVYIVIPTVVYRAIYGLTESMLFSGVGALIAIMLAVLILERAFRSIARKLFPDR
jgi:hypothetical protein